MTKAKKIRSRVILYVLVVLIVVWTVSPFLFLIIASISRKKDLLQVPYKWFPAHPTLKNYKDMLFGTSGNTASAAAKFMSSMRNSLVVTLVVVAISLFVGLLAAYAYSRFRFRGRDVMMNITMFTRMIPAVAVIIPLYMILLKLKLVDTRLGLIITYLSFVLPYITWIMKGYIDGIPQELEESAMIDGCSRLGAFFRIVLPMAATGLAATVIFAFILSWNEFFYAMNFTQTQNAKTLSVVLTEFSSKFGPNFVLSATAGVIAAAPPVIIALIFQKYIISGLSAGAVKG